MSRGGFQTLSVSLLIISAARSAVPLRGFPVALGIAIRQRPAAKTRGQRELMSMRVQELEHSYLPS